MNPRSYPSPSGVKKPIAVAAQAFRAYGFKILLVLVVSGCAAAGVAETNDPYKKLAQAKQLSETGRIAAASRLLFDAMETFEQQGDDRGLAEAYRTYAFLVRVNGVDTVLRLGPPDPSQAATNEDGRMDISIEYFEKALALAEANDKQGLITNLHYNIAISHYYAGRLGEACSSFDRSLASYRKSAGIKVDRIVDLPPGVKSFPELIDRAKQVSECV